MIDQLQYFILGSLICLLIFLKKIIKLWLFGLFLMLCIICEFFGFESLTKYPAAGMFFVVIIIFFEEFFDAF